LILIFSFFLATHGTADVDADVDVDVEVDDSMVMST